MVKEAVSSHYVSSTGLGKLKVVGSYPEMEMSSLCA